MAAINQQHVLGNQGQPPEILVHAVENMSLKVKIIACSIFGFATAHTVNMSDLLITSIAPLIPSSQAALQHLTGPSTSAMLCNYIASFIFAGFFLTFIELCER